jgi:hypothetical protein
MDDRGVIRAFEGFHNSRFLGFLALALLAFALGLGGVVGGVRENQVAKITDAMVLAPDR